MVAIGTLLSGCSDGDPADATSTTTTAPDEMTAPSTPTFTGDRDSPFCTLIREVDITAVLGGASDEDPAAVGEAFRALVDLLVEAAERSPDEITPDVGLVANGMVALDAALAEVAYDFDALAASGAGDEILQAINDPVFSQAGARLSAYRQQVCEA